MIRAKTTKVVSKGMGASPVRKDKEILDHSRFCAPENNARSSFKLKSTSIKFAPASSCMIIPDVTMGLMPNSIRVPRFEARMVRNQYRGSDESDDMIP